MGYNKFIKVVLKVLKTINMVEAYPG